MVVGDELAGVIDVRTVVAGGHKGRRADPHVDLLRPGFPQQVDGPAAGGAPDDGVVDQHHPLALHHGADGVQLDIDLVFPHGLSGGDEGAADVLVLDEPTNGLDPAGMKQLRDLFKMLCSEYGITLIISSHLLSEIESIADTIGVINHGKMMKEISMKEISEMNTAYIELAATDTKKAAYVLAEKMELNNFKIIDDLKIRIYEVNVTTQEISKELMLNDVEIISINKHTETLEDYFLKMTAEVGK